MSNTASLSDFAIQLREFISRGVSRGPTEQEFDRLAHSLFAAQFEANESYRKFCLARSISPSKVTDWPEIPAMPTTAFREFAVTSLPSDQRETSFQSSGTTGESASRHYHNADSLAVYEASLLPWFHDRFFADVPYSGAANSKGTNVGQAFKCANSGDRELECGDWKVADTGRHECLPYGATPNRWPFILSLTPPPQFAPRSSLVHMFATVHREFGAAGSDFAAGVDEYGAWRVDVSKCCEMLEDAAQANSPIAVLGTAFNFVQLLDDLSERGIRFQLPPGSRVLETGGYKGRSRELSKSDLHNLISEKLGIPNSQIISEYGMCELSSQAYDSTAGVAGLPRVFQFPPWAQALVVSPETGREVGIGETGLIRIFDLANVWSVMAIQTADLGVRRENGFELLGRAANVEPRGCSLMSL